MRSLILFVSVFVTLCTSQILISPPLGWNTWDAYEGNISEALFLSESNWLADNLASYGYTFSVIDGGWDSDGADGSTDGYSRTVPTLNLWPSSANGVGLKAVADSLNAQGLQLGLHLMRGINKYSVEKNEKIYGTPYHASDIALKSDVCVWDSAWYGVNMTHPGGVAFYNSLIDQMASWHVAFIKVDCIGFGRDQHDADIIAISNAIKRVQATQNWTILLSLSPGASAVPSDVGNMNMYVDAYRITNDLWDCWDTNSHGPNCGDGITITDDIFGALPQWQKFMNQPGLHGYSFPDADMLPIGVIYPNRASSLNADQEKVLVTLWAMFRNPLMIGSQLANMPDHTFEAVTNSDVLLINQYGTQNDVFLVDSVNRVTGWKSFVAPWHYVALFNIHADKAQAIQFTFEQVGLSASTTCQLYDVWNKKALGSAQGKYSATLASATTLLLKLSDCTN